MPTLTVTYILVAAVLGVLLGALFGSLIGMATTGAARKAAETLQDDLEKRDSEIETLRTQLTEAQERAVRAEEEAKYFSAVKPQLEEAEQSRDQFRRELESERIENGRLKSELDSERKKVEEFLPDQFKTLAQAILEKNSQDFAEQNKTSIGTLLKPVAETLEKLSTHTRELESKREGAYQAVVTEIKNMQSGTTQLLEALRKPQVRGNWGQQQLERCIEFAGMVKHVSFDVEVFVRSEEKSLRPDCVVNLPNHRTIVIDVKTPLESILNASAATDESERAVHLANHARRVKEHLNELSSKAYHRQFKESPDFVVCFLPSEASFSAALEQDPGLIEFGSNSNVILATPTTLIALLKAVAYGWQQMEITRNAIAIREAGTKIYDKLATAHDHFSKLGNSLSSTIRNYNNLVGSVEGRGGVFSLTRKLHELGIGEGEITETSEVELSARHITADDWISNPEEGLALAAGAEDVEPEEETD